MGLGSIWEPTSVGTWEIPLEVRVRVRVRVS